MFTQESKHQKEELVNHAQANAVTSSSQQQQRIYRITSGHLSPLSIEQYESAVNQFLNHFHVTDIQVLLDYGRDAIQAMVIKYIAYLRDERKLCHSSIKGQVAALYYFLEGEDIMLNKQKIRRQLPYDDKPKQRDRPYTVEEIQRILSRCDERTKVIVLLMASSGMRIDAVRELQLGDLKKQEIRNFFLIYRIQVYARSRHSYYTFCSPECARAIDEYLACRERFGEDISTKKTSPLIREQYNREDSIRIKSPRPHLYRTTPIYLINDVLVRSGVKTKEVRASHGLRKYFMSNAERYMKSINVEILMGHDIGVSGHYYRPTESEVLEDYLKAVDALTIDPSQRLVRENQELRDDLKGFEHLRDEIEELKHWVRYAKDPKHTLKELSGHVMDELYNEDIKEQSEQAKQAKLHSKA
jgi:integrase